MSHLDGADFNRIYDLSLDAAVAILGSHDKREWVVLRRCRRAELWYPFDGPEFAFRRVVPLCYLDRPKSE
jgi:hypothetical protein